MAEKTSATQKLKNKEIKRWWAPAFTLAAIVIFAISGWSWWHFVYSNPERTFFGALENHLRTAGLTRHVTQISGDQKLEQNVGLTLGAGQVAHGFTTITQQGEVNATIKTETISTPKEDHVRYTAIETNQKGQDGKDLDFTQLVNIWGKSAEGDASQTAGELYNESVLGVIPVGNLPADKRKEIIKFIHEKAVYDIDGNDVKRGIEGGRPVYTYKVTVAPEAYIGMLKMFGKAVGLTQLEMVDPASYKDTQPLVFEIKVDVWGRHITHVMFAEGERTERLSGFGISRHVDKPKDTIPLEELQTRLQSVQ